MTNEDIIRSLQDQVNIWRIRATAHASAKDASEARIRTLEAAIRRFGVAKPDSKEYDHAATAMVGLVLTDADYEATNVQE